MTFDMSQFYQVFFEETEEHLAMLESLLLRLDPEQPDPADIAEIFRAAHSIKGSSATFGFNDLTDVTHVFENLLDGVRKNEIRMHRAMVDACLAAVDVLANLLDAHRGRGEADRAAATAVRERLQAVYAEARAAGAGSAPSLPPVPAPPRSASPAGVTDVAPEAGCYELRFVMSRLMAGSEVLVNNLLQELADLGAIRCCLRPDAGSAGGEWCVRLQTRCAPDELRAVLDLATEPGTLSIEPVAEDGSGAQGGHHGADDGGPSMVSVLDSGVEVFEEAEDGSYGFFVPVGRVREEDETPPPAGLAGGESAPRVAEPAAATVDDGRVQARAGSEGSIRVSVDKVDQIINLVGELVITRSILQEAASHMDAGVFERLADGLAQLERNTRELQESVMSIRMVPVSMVFSRFPRLVHDLSKRLGKQVELRLEGEHTELDKGLVERIADPLTHLVRNSLDHGIESPAQRLARGKPETGTITLRASHQGGYIVIEVCDDGGGLDRARILARAAERGLPVSEAMSDAEVWQLIFEPGFSTADSVTEVSGRGVGMDVVKNDINSLGGRVAVESSAGAGTRVAVHLPLTLAILDGMIAAVGGECYIIPLNFIVESLQPTADMIRSVGGAARMIQVRGEYLPVIGLGELFQVPGAVRDWTAGIMVLVEVNGYRTALFVDALVGQQQVVIKSLEANFRRVAGFSGATILGDGRVALILDMAVVAGGSRRSLAVAA